MSILSDKHILIIGDESKQIVDLEALLRQENMHITVAACGDTTVAELTAKKFDIVLLNHLHDGDLCDTLLSDLRGTRVTKVLPIFALVENTESKINEALMLGAADYITTAEPIESIIQKMKFIFGQPDYYSGGLVFDVPVDDVDVSAKGLKVFVIEDDPLLCNLLVTRLQKSSFQYEFSFDGEDIIDKMCLFKPQVIILDLMLPVVDGFEILTELKMHDELKHVPVIIFSNRDSDDDKNRVFAMGADRFYVKAMTDLSVLIGTIEELAE